MQPDNKLSYQFQCDWFVSVEALIFILGGAGKLAKVEIEYLVNIILLFP
jgi:hypothetical protein